MERKGEQQNGMAQNGVGKTTPEWSLQGSLAEMGIKSRPNASAGPWCAVLLPCAVVWGASDGTGTYREVAEVAGALLLASMDLVWSIAHGTTWLRWALYCTVATCMAATHGIVWSVVCLAAMVGSQVETLRLMRLCPGSFTLGEAIVAIQALFLFLAAVIRSVMKGATVESEVAHVNVTLAVGLLGVILICRLPLAFELLKQPVPFYAMSGVIIGGIVLPTIWYLFGEFPLLWFVRFASAPHRLALIAFWGACTLACILLVKLQVATGEKATTRIRKYFHFFQLAMYIPGILFDYAALYLASGVALGVFCAMEAVRLLSLPPVGHLVHSSLQLFVDEKDQGPLILTHTYLLVGCSTPLWLHPNPTMGAFLALNAGLIAVGVGDAAASIGGSLFGRTKWPMTAKTVEGTLCSVVSQAAIVACMFYAGWIPVSTTTVAKATVAVLTTAMVESLTDQVDNLVLPLIAYVILV